jgi:hypothetical protein
MAVWQATRSPGELQNAAWSAATLDDLQEGERIVAELAMMAAGGDWLKKADGSIRRLKAIVKALE